MRAAAICLAGNPRALLVLSPDGRLAALAEGNKVRVYDTATGDVIVSGSIRPVDRSAI